MNRGRFVFAVVLALAAASALAQSPSLRSGPIFSNSPKAPFVAPPSGTTVVLLDDFSKTDIQNMLQLSGNAKFMDGRLRLTDAGNQVGGAFLKAPMQLSDYMASFDFEVRRVNAGDNPADGFTFAAQALGADKLGAGGGGIGYGRTDGASGFRDAQPRDVANGGFVGYSYAVDFNSYDVQGLPESAQTVALDILGTRTRLGATPFPHVDQGVLHADVRVTPNRLVLLISGGSQKLIPTVAFTSPPFIVGFFQAPAPLYFGFTGGTGGLQQITDILNFRIQTGLPPL